jgi:hypothetical protein
MDTKHKEPALFATAPNGKLYVQLHAIMHPLIAACDGVPVTFFGDEVMPYLDVDTALDWCRKESKHHSEEKFSKMIAAMEKAKRQETDKN